MAGASETGDDRLCRSLKFYLSSKRKIHFVRPSSGMTLLEAERAKPRTGGKDSALRDWVRALEATAPIAGNPQRILPGVIEELAETRGDAPALLSAGECLTYRALDDRANRYARWALAAKPRQGRDGVPGHAEPARIHGDLARHHQRGWRRFADQHQSARYRRSLIASISSSRSTSSSPPSCAAKSDAALALHGEPAKGLVARQ